MDKVTAKIAARNVKRGFPIIVFCFAANDNHVIRLTGRYAETLRKLAESRLSGVTVLEFRGGPAYRLAAYIHYLRGLGLSIETKRERHDCGTHARYVLHTEVRIISVKVAANDN